MAAGDILLRIRNEADTGWKDVIVSTQPGSPLQVDFASKPRIQSPPGGTPSAVATAGAGTYTAAQISTGVITRDCAGAARTDTTDTAAAIIAAIPSLATLYAEYSFYVVNITAATYTITLAGGTGVSLTTTMAILIGGSAKITLQNTGAGTLSMRFGS